MTRLFASTGIVLSTRRDATSRQASIQMQKQLNYKNHNIMRTLPFFGLHCLEMETISHLCLEVKSRENEKRDAMTGKASNMKPFVHYRINVRDRARLSAVVQ